MNRNCVFLLFAILAIQFDLLTAQSIPSYIPSNGLVGWWPFNGNANDESGNGNHGVVNGATLTSDRNGNSNKAYSFDGVNDYIEGIASNLPIGSSARTISSWILLPESNTQYLNFLISWGLGTASQSSANQAFGLMVNLPNLVGLWQSFGISSQNEVFSNANLAENNYFHLATIVDNSGNFKFYINSQEVYNNTIIGLNTISNGYVYRIGRSTHTNTDGWAGYFNGNVDDVAIWNRALTPQEITNLYNGFTPPSVTTSLATNITTSIADSGGNITSDGGSPITARGVVWSTSPNPTTALTTKTTDGSGTGTFTSSLTGLTPNTKYYVRAYATNTAVTTYGNEVSFTTKSDCLPDYIPTDGLVGYWPFCGNANDESGNGNHGVVNGATLTSDRNGKSNKAYSFDGVNDYINAGQPNLTSTFTLSFWILLNTADFQYPIGLGINSANNVDDFKGYGIGYSSANPPCQGLGASKYFVYDAVSTCYTWIESSTINPISEWKYLTISKNGNITKLYIDGQLDVTSTTLNLPGILNLFFGTRSDLFTYFNGKIDDVSLWNRELTIQEIQDIYNGCPQAAFVSPPADITLSCLEVLSLQTSPASLNYTNNSTGSCEISGSVTGVITGTADECGGSLTQTWTFTDEYDRIITHVQGIIVSPAPQAAWVNAPADITISCDAATTFTASSLSYTNGATGTCLISGSATGVLSGTFNECGGTLTQIWTYTDDCGRTIEHTQTITVDPATIPAWINAPADITISCDAATTFTASSLSYTNGGTGTCLISGSATGILSGSFYKCGGTLTQTWTFTDDCSRTIDHTQTITVDPAPQADWVSAPTDLTISCDEASRFTPQPVSYSNNGLGTCLISGTVTPVVTRNYNDCGGTIDAEWQFLDQCGRVFNHVQRTTVLPKPAVSWVNPPANITISCAEAGELAPTFLAYSNSNAGYCLQSGYILSTFNATTFNCGTNYTQTWAYTDQCNRAISHTQQITVGLPDQDGDSATDATDNCPDKVNANQADTDSDGVGDACDNCPNTANANQSDCNGNGVGDACDVPDADCDGIPDTTDNCPDYPNPNQTDLNSNGTGDACETGKRFGVNTTTPQSEVHVADGSVYIDNPDKGIIMKGADGKCYKLTIHNGALQLLVVPCPGSNQNR